MNAKFSSNKAWNQDDLPAVSSEVEKLSVTSTFDNGDLCDACQCYEAKNSTDWWLSTLRFTFQLINFDSTFLSSAIYHASAHFQLYYEVFFQRTFQIIAFAFGEKGTKKDETKLALFQPWNKNNGGFQQRRKQQKQQKNRNYCAINLSPSQVFLCQIVAKLKIRQVLLLRGLHQTRCGLQKKTCFIVFFPPKLGLELNLPSYLHEAINSAAIKSNVYLFKLQSPDLF